MYWSYSEHAQKLISGLDLKQKSGSEYGVRPCPNCGGDDRFWINEFQGRLYHHCRQGCDFSKRTSAIVDRGLLPNPDGEKIPYSTKKQVPLLGEADLENKNVVIPLRHVLSNEIVGKQTIYPDGSKTFEKGTKKSGAGVYIGEPTDVLYLCEGWATAVAVHLSTDQQTLFCLDAKTLVKTSKLLTHQNIIVAADHDKEGLSAAKETGLAYAFPEEEGLDWWDVWDREGNKAVLQGLQKLCGVAAEKDILQGLSISTGLELSAREFALQVWLKDNLLPIPNFILICGAPKAGKSWYAMGLAHELTSKGHTVVYIGNEDNERRLKERYAKICDSPSTKLIFISGLSSEKPMPRGTDALLFISALKKKFPDLKCIFIDTLQAIREPTRKENYANVETEFAAIRKLAHELKITIIGVHHTKKANGEFENTPIDKILGSQGIAATVETIIILEQVRGSQDVNLFITGKDVQQQEEYRLHWTDKGFSEPQNKILAERGPFQKKVIEFVKDHPRCTQMAIAEALGRKRQQVNEAVDTLIECGILKSSQGRLICSLT